MFGFGEDAGRLRAFLAEGHLLKIPMGDACLVVEVPRYLPWTAAATALAALGGWAAWRWLGGRAEETFPNVSAARASVAVRSRRAKSPSSPPPSESPAPRVSRRSRGKPTSRSASGRSRRR